MSQLKLIPVNLSLILFISLSINCSTKYFLKQNNHPEYNYNLIMGRSICIAKTTIKNAKRVSDSKQIGPTYFMGGEIDSVQIVEQLPEIIFKAVQNKLKGSSYNFNTYRLDDSIDFVKNEKSNKLYSLCRDNNCDLLMQITVKTYSELNNSSFLDYNLAVFDIEKDTEILNYNKQMNNKTDLIWDSFAQNMLEILTFKNK